MTDDDLNRRLAEALEPGPILEDYPGFYSRGLLWLYTAHLSDSKNKWTPRDFCSDGNAMLALMNMAKVKGVEITIGRLIVTARDLSVGHGWFSSESITRPPLDTEIPRAVAEAAARALKVWEE